MILSNEKNELLTEEEIKQLKAEFKKNYPGVPEAINESDWEVDLGDYKFRYRKLI